MPADQIGRALNDVLDPMQIEALNTDVDELDITDTDEVINFGTVNRPECESSTVQVSQILMSVRKIRNMHTVSMHLVQET